MFFRSPMVEALVVVLGTKSKRWDGGGVEGGGGGGGGQHLENRQ